MSGLRPRSRTWDEQGTVAIIVALCAALLFSMAALTVDLGNAMVRKRDVQSQADFAALAAGAKLAQGNTKSASDPAVLAVADYLTENQPQDDRPGSMPPVTGTQLVDGNDTNGEVYFNTTEELRVIAPQAHVNFGLANVMGFSNARVQAAATVGLRSPGPAVPFFLPSACTAGRLELKASNYNPNAPAFDPPSANGGSIAKVDSTNPLTVPGAVASTVTIFGEKFTSGMTIDFFHEASGDRVPLDKTQGHPATLTKDTGKDDEATTVLPPRVFNTPGRWYLRVDNGNGYSKDAVSFLVGNPIPPPAGCGVKSTGDFGVLDSPRKLVTQLADASALNMAIGLDHDLVLFKGLLPPQGPDSCNGNGATPFPGAQPDKISQPGNNCVDVKNGMNTDVVTDGMVTGGSTSQGAYKGRLNKDTLTGCDRNNGSDEAMRIGYATNDDVLSCFLPAGVTVGNVSGTSIAAIHEKTISSRIFDSPRFMVVPVIDFPVNPQNGFYPLIKYQPVFITDESPTSQKGTSYATSTNGVIIQSSKVVGVTVVAINPKALPETADTTGGTVPYTGSGTKIIRLMD